MHLNNLCRLVIAGFLLILPPLCPAAANVAAVVYPAPPDFGDKQDGRESSLFYQL